MHRGKGLKTGKTLLGMLMVLAFLCLNMQSYAAGNSIYSYITEFSINNETWKYGEEKKSIQLSSGIPVSAEYTLYFTAEQWEAYHKNLLWELPAGVKIMHINEAVYGDVDGKNTQIGSMNITDSVVQITLFEEYETLIKRYDNIEIRAGLVLEFEKATHNLGESFTIEAKETGRATARWNDYSIKVNKLSAEDSAKILGGAKFEIQEYKYSENSHEYKENGIFDLSKYYVEENNTFVQEGAGIVTLEDTTALLVTEFEPGCLYLLNEVRPPAGYLPAEESIKFGFYRYTDSKKEGTLRKIQELNSEYKKRYENEGAVAVFGQENGVLGEGNHNIYVKNAKAPKMQVLKTDAKTGEAIANVTFTLRIFAEDALYSPEQYTSLENARWTYNEAKGTLEWVQKTDANGRIIYMEGTIPYSPTGYELIETVPEGYEGYGGELTSRFTMGTDGTVTVLNGSAAVRTVDDTITITVENHRTAELKLLKVNESGEPLEGAEFALYTQENTGSEDTLKKDGVTYYYKDSKASDADGKAVFKNLSYGTYYLVETKAPDGYKILKDAYRVEIGEDTLDDGVCTLEIINTKKGVEIVPTGGRGNWPYWAAGAVLFIVGSAFFFVSREKKRRRRKRAAAKRRKNGQTKKKEN